MRKRQYIIAGISICLAAGITCWFAVRRPVKHSTPPVAAHQVLPVEKGLAILANNPGIKATAHTVYPYSVIAGGAHSSDELRAAISRDRVVREHYSGFDLDKVKVVKLAQPRLAFVSFRKGNQVYWTHKQLKLEAGELVLTDGKNYARTRCGNRLSDTASVHLTSPDIADDVVSVMPPDVKLLADLDFGLDRSFKPDVWMSPSPTVSAADAQPGSQLSPFGNAGAGGYGGGGGGFPYVPGHSTTTGTSGGGSSSGGGSASPALTLPRTSNSDPSDPGNSHNGQTPTGNGGGSGGQTGNPPNTPPGGGSNPLATPEPASALLLIPAFSLLFVCRRSLRRG